MDQLPPLIGLTPDFVDGRIALRPTYLDAVRAAGGLPVVLSGDTADVASAIAHCDGLIFTGGDDPIMEAFGTETHPAATPVDPRRQAFELALLAALDHQPDKPVLGVCLGMQMMGLHAGGVLDQHLPDTLHSFALHADGSEHGVDGELGEGVVWSRHRQALVDPGSLRVVATAEDGVIEAVEAADRRHYLGVQWHPERTAHEAFGDGLFRRLIEAASAS